MTMFVNSPVPADDSRLPRIYDHFRANLEDICTDAAAANVPVIVCTVPINLKDSAPFGSAHAPNLDAAGVQAWDEAYQDGTRLEAEGKFADAARRHEEAARIDDRFADLAYRLGRCYAAIGDAGEARRHFVRARDLDTLRFRADTTINDTTRAVAASRASQGIRLADAERAFDEASPSGIPGEEFFLEHVHMNFHGNYTLARTVFQSLAELAPPSLGPPAGEVASPPTEAECAERLAWTDWNELKLATQVQERLLRQPPFTGQLDTAERDKRWTTRRDDLQARLLRDGPEKTRAVYRKAAEAAKDDWMIRLNYGQFLNEAGDADAAEFQYLAALKSLNHCFAAHCKLGQLQFATGRVAEAKAEYHEALRLAPDCSEALYGLADTLAAEGKVAEGQAICEERLSQEPDRSAALVALGAYLARNGKAEEARSRFAEALEANSANAMAHVHLAEADMKDRKVDAAIAHYEAALKIRPEWPELREHLAKVRKETKAP
jgi:tetratricopeptide (TPR) repeat protein